MTLRQRLPNRRASLTFEIASQGLQFTCSASWFADGSAAEVFLQNYKAGSMAGINAQDSAVVCSLCLQHGVPLETIRRALMRDARGAASGLLGVALDMIAQTDGGAPC